LDFRTRLFQLTSAQMSRRKSKILRPTDIHRDADLRIGGS
jgi:hypothetical protein